MNKDVNEHFLLIKQMILAVCFLKNNKVVSRRCDVWENSNRFQDTGRQILEIEGVTAFVKMHKIGLV